MTSVAALATASSGFRYEDGIAVYVAPVESRPERPSDWFFDEVARLDASTLAAGRQGPLRLLIDLRPWSTTTGGGERSTVYRRHGEFRHHRVAVLGESRIHEFVIRFLVAATGHRTTRYFTDEHKAREWLRREDDGHA